MKSLLISRQSRRPSGLLGYLVAHGMARDTAACNDRAVALLDVQPTDRVLEVGSGHGRTVQTLAARAPAGFVAGIDFSPAMHTVATRWNRAAIRAGRVRLHLGDSSALPFRTDEFDKALTVHTIYFWADPALHLGELWRVLRPGGRLVVGFRPNDDGGLAAELPAEVYRLYRRDDAEALLREAGFGAVTIEAWTHKAKQYAYAVAEK